MFRTLTPIFSVVIGIALFFFFTKPQYDEVTALKTERQEYQTAVANASQFNQKLTELVQKKNAYSARELDRLDTLVSYNVDEVKLLVDLEDMIRSHGMLLADIAIKISDTETETLPNNTSRISFEEDFNATDIAFTLIGTYEQFRSLLGDIEKSLMLMEVVGIDFAAHDGPLQLYEVTVRSYELTR